ncbi:MAG TPA: DEAD/DEAH box helicase, partial [Caulobacteraceae bacterium]|nr:DEAD/DEAH box helicase [Caulobacteraceae bacterium]
DLERIFKLTPVKKQTLFFSATMPPEITRLTKQFLKDPVRIEASKPATAGENITQYLVRIPQGDPASKRVALRALVGRDEVKNGIVFCNRKTEVDVVAKSLKKHGFDASPIHGDLDQSMRTKTLDAFRKGELKLLVASDVAARGLDIPDVSHVFNYDVPHHADDYVHRIGRTGRAGKSGVTYMLVTPADARNLDKVLKLIGTTPGEVTLEVDWSAVKTETRARPERGRRERADPKGRSRGRPASETSVASMEPLVPTISERPPASARPPLPAPVSEETAPPRSRRRGERPSQTSAPRGAARPTPAQAPPPAQGPPPAERRRGVQPVAERDDDDRRIVGFGAELPAFLARPIPVPAGKR